MLDNLISCYAASGIKARIASPRIVDCFYDQLQHPADSLLYFPEPSRKIWGFLPAEALLRRV